jgi:DNA invertase Pin-like site-specific DNA recombinase
MKAAVYLRVSKEVGQDEANQEPDCLRVCQVRRWEPVIYRERMSGAKLRPVWTDVLTAAHRAEISAVIVWSLDRAGRDRLRLCHDMAELARKGVQLVSVRETWLDQPPGPMRELMIAIMTWVYSYERERTIERIAAGQARARREGKHIGRRWLPADKVGEIRRQFEAGVSSFLAAKELRMPESTVRTYYKRFAK